MSTNGNTIITIKEIYENENSEEYFESELERALDIGCEVIIIEPTRLADETARWIKVGNCLHRSAIIFGLSSICFSVAWNHNTHKLSIPLTAVSVFCAGLYMISWQFDPCCKYQIASKFEKMELKKKAEEKLRQKSGESIHPVSDDFFLLSAGSTSPVILLRKDDTTRKIIHSVVALFAFTFTIIRFCKK